MKKNPICGRIRPRVMKEWRRSHIEEFERFERRVSEQLKQTEPEILKLPDEEYGSQIKSLVKANFPNQSELHTSHFTYEISENDESGFKLDIRRVDLDPNLWPSAYRLLIGRRNKIFFSSKAFRDVANLERVDISNIDFTDETLYYFDPEDFINCLAAERMMAILQQQLIKKVGINHGVKSENFMEESQEELVKYFARTCKEYPLEMRHARVSIGGIHEKSRVVNLLAKEKLIGPVGKLLSGLGSGKKTDSDNYKPRRVELKDGLILEINERRQDLELLYL